MLTCFRELSFGARQWMEGIELASELLSESIRIDISVGVAGSQPLYWTEYKALFARIQ